ncbi:hypothetical protein F4803DRAFT_509569 [Xylaria telfairii]|nr:hypothetical protein F4803DRAFT_509569 [Xylaria telfairii]
MLASAATRLQRYTTMPSILFIVNISSTWWQAGGVPYPEPLQHRTKDDHVLIVCRDLRHTTSGWLLARHDLHVGYQAGF